jgi:hypothetical protein
VASILRDADLDRMTPIDALTLLHELKGKLRVDDCRYARRAARRAT